MSERGTDLWTRSGLKVFIAHYHMGRVSRRATLNRVRTLPPDVLDYLLFLPAISLTCGLGMALRVIGPLFLVIPVGFCLLYALLRRAVPPRWLTVYIAICLLFAVLSEYRALPKSWEVRFLDDAVPRQLIPIVTYFVTSWATKAYFARRLLNGDILFCRSLIMFLSIVAAPAAMIADGLSYQGETLVVSALAQYGALTNSVAISSFFLLGFIFFERGWQRYFALSFMVIVAATSHYVQYKILTIIVIALLCGAPTLFTVAAAIGTLIAIYGVMLPHVNEVIIENSNAGIRLAFISDAISSVIDTAGIGIGFGTESVRWEYHFPDMPVFTLLPDPHSMSHDRMLEALSTGVENSFVEAALRTGVPGFIILVVSFLAAFPSRLLRADLYNHAAVLFALTAIGCFVNSTLESPLAVVGHGFIYGYLVALNAYALRVHGILRRPIADAPHDGTAQPAPVLV